MHFLVLDESQRVTSPVISQMVLVATTSAISSTFLKCLMRFFMMGLLALILALKFSLLLCSFELCLGRLLWLANDFRWTLLFNATYGHDSRCAEWRTLQWLKRLIPYFFWMIRNEGALYLGFPFEVHQPGVSDPVKNNLILLNLVHLRELNKQVHLQMIPPWRL